jgi:hypothetical protein
MNPSAPRKSFSVKEIGHRNNLGRTSIYGEISSGRLKASKVGARTIVTCEAEEEWLRSLPKVGE